MISLRTATPDDAEALLERARALSSAESVSPEPHPTTMTPAQLASDLADMKTRGLLACQGSDMLGFALYSFMHFSLSGVHLYLDDLYVDPHHRGSGVGRRLMSELARRAQDEGCAGMTWFVERTNSDAERFYERLGAHRVASRNIMSLTDLRGLIPQPT